MTSWKRDVTLFAVTMIALVVIVAGTSSSLMWRQLRGAAAGEAEWAAKVHAASTARQAIMEVDRLLMKTIVLKEPDAVRRAAVASIAAATRVEDAVNALRDTLPNDNAVRDMATAVDDVKGPRMRVIGLARRGDASAVAALGAIEPSLRNIDEMSQALLQRLDQERNAATEARQHKLHTVLLFLGGAGLGGIALGLTFYIFLMRRLTRVDLIEHLLTEVRQGSRQLTEDGDRLNTLNGELQAANAVLGSSIARFRTSFTAMDQESDRAVEQLGAIASACDRSAATSREQAAHAAEVAQHIGTTVAEMTGLRTVTQELGGSQRQIADFTDRIARIAATTRLLSMNAAVEAARAGAAGRGFNMVAQSIRQLSDETQEAAGEIRRTNDHIASQLRLTLDAVGRTGTHMDTCAEQAGALQSSARENCGLVESVAARLSEFHDVMNRQTQRVRKLDADVAVLDRSLEVGKDHAERLDLAAGSLGQMSSSMQARLASVS